MKKLFAVLLIAASSLAAAASDTNVLNSMGFNELPEAERAEIMQRVAAAKAKVVTDKSTATTALSVAKSTTPEKVGEWLDVGTKIGQMFGGAAKEVGVAVNEFVKTPVGQWTMAIIVWKYMGAAIVHITGGLLLLIIGSITAFLVYRAGIKREVIYDLEKKNVFGNYPIKHVKQNAYDSDYMVGSIITMLVTVIVALSTVFTM